MIPRRGKPWFRLCRTLDKTPPDQLESALKPILDIDGALWFLALDNALVNGDGYWTRASDYSRLDHRRKYLLEYSETKKAAP